MHPRKLVRDSLGLALSHYVSRFVLLGRGIAAAAALGPLTFGVWNALNLLFDYGGYASCGALQGLDVKLPPEAARGDEARAQQLMRGAWSVVLVGGLLFAIATVLYLASGHRLIAAPWGWGAPLLMLVAALVQLVIHYHLSVLRAYDEFQTASTAQALQAVLGGGLGLALVWRLGVWGLLGGWLVGGIVALLWLRRGRRAPPIKPGLPADGLGLVRIGFPIFGYFTASLVLRSVDRIAFVRYAGTEGLGQYSLGLMAAGLILFLPEAASTVLVPRVSAAAHGARDLERTRAEVRQTHRALAVLLPTMVALGMVWAGPITGWLLPAFVAGIPALRFLALGALLLATATLPGYFVMASGKAPRLFAVGAAAAILTAALVFSVAARDHRPASIALAASCGYGVFALGLVTLAAPGLCANAGERLAFTVLSFVPALWGAGLALAACAVGHGETVGAALVRSLAILAGYLPVLWWFGRGAGLRRLAHEWLSGRVAPA